MQQIDIAGLKINSCRKSELLAELENRLTTKQQTWLVTLYSEFLYASLRDHDILSLLNRADLAVADGIAMPWAQTFLNQPLTAKGYWGKILQSITQAKWLAFLAVVKPQTIKKTIPEKIVGADLVWDVAKLAANKHFSIFLLGGKNGVTKIAAKKLQQKFPNLNIVGYCEKNADDISIVQEIKNARPDILLVAFGPIKQENWINQNLPNLPVKLAIGVGGTFDYLAGKHPSPPKFLRQIGLEWAWRLITQPKRAKRIFQATFGLTLALVKYKVFFHLPLRKNVVSIVANNENKIFIAKFNPEKKAVKAIGIDSKKFTNYWQFPQGGIDNNEEIAEAASRELREETAMTQVKILKVSNKTFTYYWKDPGRRPLFVKKRYRYGGQKQNIVYFKFNGADNEIILDKDELIEYKWVSVETLVESVHEEKQTVAKIATEEFPLILGLKTLA